MLYTEVTKDEFIIKMWQSHEPKSHRFSDLGLSKLFEFLSAEDIEFDQDKVAKEWIEYETAEIANKDCNLAMTDDLSKHTTVIELFGLGDIYTGRVLVKRFDIKKMKKIRGAIWTKEK